MKAGKMSAAILGVILTVGVVCLLGWHRWDYYRPVPRSFSGLSLDSAILGSKHALLLETQTGEVFFVRLIDIRKNAVKYVAGSYSDFSKREIKRKFVGCVYYPWIPNPWGIRDKIWLGDFSIGCMPPNSIFFAYEPIRRASLVLAEDLLRTDDPISPQWQEVVPSF
jgi:hypothetical protein